MLFKVIYLISLTSISNKTKHECYSEDFKDKKERIFLCKSSTLACASLESCAYVDAYMTHTSLHFFVLSFVLACAYAYAYVASENQAISHSKTDK